VSEDLSTLLEMIAAGTESELSFALLLGLPTDAAAVRNAVDAGLEYNAWERLLRNTGLDREALRATLQIPARTLSRRKSKGRFSPTESDRIVRIVRLIGDAIILFEGDVDAARTWLTSPNRGLGGATPLRFAATDLGARDVERLIGRLEYGIPS